MPFPTPPWVAKNAAAQLEFKLCLAALYHHKSGSIKKLSLAIGRSHAGLHMILARMKKGEIHECPKDVALQLEDLLGPENFPREMFLPNVASR